MVSSLASQLAQGASLNASLLVDKSKRKHTESYLFTGREADHHDLESIHALARNALLQLQSLDSSFAALEDDDLFSDAAKDVDRTMLPREANTELDGKIARTLRKLSPYLLEGPSGKILEWLVRRFRIHEFNTEDVLALFLPYHESPHFAKMLTILHIQKQSTWGFLLPFKSAAKNVPRISLVKEMLINTDLARFIVSLVPTAIKQTSLHRTLLVFHAATLHDFIKCSQKLDEGTVAYILPSLLQSMQISPKNPLFRDAILGAYVLLSAFSQKCHLAPKALKSIVAAMAGGARHVAPRQFVTAAVAVCDPQAVLDAYSDGACKSILGLPNIENELREASAWGGIEKFVCPLLPSLITRLNDEPSSPILNSLLTAPTTPSAVIRHASKLLVKAIVSTGEPEADTSPYRLMLYNIRQRYPLRVQEAANLVTSENTGVKDAVQRLVVSLTVPPGDVAVAKPGKKGKKKEADPTKKGVSPFISASSQNDSTLRAHSVLKISEWLAKNEGDDVSLVESARSALLARIKDSSPAVIKALYSHPAIVLPILIENAEYYLTGIKRALNALTPVEPIVLAHLGFLAHHFCPAQPEHSARVFSEAFVPFMLFSAPRRELVRAVWDILAAKEAEEGLGRYELLGGCIDTWTWEADKGAQEMRTKFEMKEERQEREELVSLTSINLSVSAKIAENILASNDYVAHFDALLLKMKERNAYTRVFAYMIMRAVLGQLSGEHQIDAAYKVLLAMGIPSLDGMDDFMDGEENLQEFLEDQKLSRNVVLDPISKKTAQWLQVSIVALFPILSPPNILIDWFVRGRSDEEEGDELADTRGARYVWFMRRVYKLINSSNGLPFLSSRLLQAFFVTLRGDSLAFLAGLWTSEPSDDTAADKNWLHLIAFRHATANLRAYTKEHRTDMQTLLPCLLLATRSADVRMRETAVECVQLIEKMAAGAEAQSVYGFDYLYGEGSDQLQYLEWKDLGRYCEAVNGQRDYFVRDPNYFAVFHQEHLQRDEKDTKKDISYKQSVLCYILSHANAIHLPDAKIALLRAVEHVSFDVKAQTLLPVMQILAPDPPSSALAKPLGGLFEEFITLTVSAFDRSAYKDLNEPESPMWSIYLQFIRHYFGSASMASPRDVLADALTHGLFTRLKIERQVELCETLLDMGVNSADAYTHCKSVLVQVLNEVPLILHLLTSLQPSTNDASPRASKRAKVDEQAASEHSAKDNLSSLSLLVEVLGSIALPGSLELITRLLETLNKVVHHESPTQADRTYIEQLLMSAVENAAEKVVEAPNLSPSVIRLDILVELVRVSENPQTFHQALLLVSSLARLAPESVLHNIMPVFTFMGSNVFHRDDSYSFRVVQQTIDSIVPVMVSSLRKAHSDRLDLYIGARDFLRVFTDAANHIPRHRRTNFFAHVVDVLGSKEFLAPVCMLLVDKVANRVVRQTVHEAQGALMLPSSIIQRYPPPLQVFVLTEILRESRRVVDHIVDPQTAQPIFLPPSADDEHAPSSASVLKRRAQALVAFVGYALKTYPSTTPTQSAPEGGAISDLVSLLIDISTVHGGATADTNVDDIAKAAHSSSRQALSVMSAADFIDAVLAMLESGENRIQAGALDLLSDRLPNITDKARHDATPTIIKIIDSIQKLLRSTSDGPLALSAFTALKTIGATVSSGEENALTNAIPLVLQALRGRKMASSAITVLLPFASKLGPRIIPFFRDIVNECVSLSYESLHGQLQAAPSLVEDAISALNALLTSIPTFWGSVEVTQVVKFFVENGSSSSGSQSLAVSSLMKAVCKRAPIKVLLPTVYETWPSAASSRSQDRLTQYFQLLRQSLRTASRPVVLEHVRPLFKVFLEAFDVPQVPSVIADEAEEKAIAAFMELVVKLNDAAFRPLFRRLYDWAFSDTGTDVRKTTFCHVYEALLDYFKGLMTPYMSFLLQPFVDILKSSSPPEELWLCVIQTLTKSFDFDEGAFWRDDKLRIVTPVIVGQVAVCIQSNIPDGKEGLSSSLVTMVDAVNDDALLKAINLDLLMHTRSEDSRLRIFALSCSEKVWRAHGGKLLGFVADASTFIAECAEDENDTVVKESHRLKDAVEMVAGNINGL